MREDVTPASDGGPPIRLVIGDDQVVLAESLRTLLVLETDLDVVGIAHTAADTVEMCARLRPDVVLLDFEFPDGNGADITPVLSDLGCRVVMLSAFTDDATLAKAIMRGVSGFVPKHANASAVSDAIRRVAVGEAAISNHLLARVLPLLGRGETSGISVSDRDREMLMLLAEGATNQEIGAQLHLSPNTVRNQLSRIYDRLGARSRLEAVNIAIREGIIRRRS